MEGFYFRDIFLMVKVYLKDLFLETKKQKIVCYYLKKKKKKNFVDILAKTINIFYPQNLHRYIIAACQVNNTRRIHLQVC